MFGLCSFWVLQEAFCSNALSCCTAGSSNQKEVKVSPFLAMEVCGITDSDTSRIGPSTRKCKLQHGTHLRLSCLFWPNPEFHCLRSSEGSALKNSLVSNILINNQVSLHKNTAAISQRKQ